MNRHFFDIGANVGQTFDLYLKNSDAFNGWHIWLFEPSPRHLDELRRRCLEFSADNTARNWTLTLCPFALSNHTGWMRLYEKTDPRGDSLFENTFLPNQRVDNAEMPVSICVPTVSIADFLFGEIPSKDRVTIKIDAEGSEYSIIDSILSSGHARTVVEKLLVEWHGLDSQEQFDGETKRLIDAINEAGIPIEGWNY